MVLPDRMNQQAARAARTACWTAVTAASLTLVACGPDLGKCDLNALGGGNVNGMLVAHTGQAIVGSTCSGGRCHSYSAKGALRFGAPAELDFDVLLNADTLADRGRVARAAGITAAWADDMWAEILDGEMPPAPPAGPGELSAADKESVRNWLACGAEAVAAPPPTTVDPTWQAIWPVLAPQCVTCHSPTTSAVGLGFVLGDLNDACGSYMHLVGATATTGNCVGMPLVVAGTPEQSLLLDKLSHNPPACGGFMPGGGTAPLVATNPALVAAIEQWIVAGAMPPACP